MNGGCSSRSGRAGHKVNVLGKGSAGRKLARQRKQLVTDNSRSKVDPIRSDVVEEVEAQIVKSMPDLWVGCRIGPHCFPTVQKRVLWTLAHGQMRRHQHTPSDHETQVPIHEQRPWS
jgi:hypothetical protein